MKSAGEFAGVVVTDENSMGDMPGELLLASWYGENVRRRFSFFCFSTSGVRLVAANRRLTAPGEKLNAGCAAVDCMGKMGDSGEWAPIFLNRFFFVN